MEENIKKNTYIYGCLCLNHFTAHMKLTQRVCVCVCVCVCVVTKSGLTLRPHGL